MGICGQSKTNTGTELLGGSDGKKVIVVTGSNRGLGKGILENIMKQKLSYKLVMTSRSKEKGEAALLELKTAYPHYAEDLYMGVLDIDSTESQAEFVSWFSSNLGKCDVLVNNAAILYPWPTFNEDNPARTDYKRAEETMRTNFTACVEISDAMLDKMNQNGKMLFYSSDLGRDEFVDSSQENQDKLSDKSLKMDGLMAQKDQYLQSVKNDTYDQDGWSKWEYGLSKLFLEVAAKIYARDQRFLDKGIQTYSMAPGQTNTGMTEFLNTELQTVDQGVSSAMMQINRPFEIGSDNGEYFDKEGKSWELKGKLGSNKQIKV